MKTSMNVPSPCDRCALRSASRVPLKDGTTFRVCDLCYWGQVDSERQEKPERIALTVAQQAETPLAAAA